MRAARNRPYGCPASLSIDAPATDRMLSVADRLGQQKGDRCSRCHEGSRVCEPPTFQIEVEPARGNAVRNHGRWARAGSRLAARPEEPCRADGATPTSIIVEILLILQISYAWATRPETVNSPFLAIQLRMTGRRSPYQAVADTSLGEDV
jgi:hypothetical protein